MTSAITITIYGSSCLVHDRVNHDRYTLRENTNGTLEFVQLTLHCGTVQPHPFWVLMDPNAARPSSPCWGGLSATPLIMHAPTLHFALKQHSGTYRIMPGHVSYTRHYYHARYLYT